MNSVHTREFSPSCQEGAIDPYLDFLMSVREMSATISPFALTTGSFPFWRRISFASASRTPSGAVIKSVVMMSRSNVLRSSTKSTSREVTMPTRRLPIAPSSVIGTPLKP
jgi:hypothetical protein